MPLYDDEDGNFMIKDRDIFRLRCDYSSWGLLFRKWGIDILRNSVDGSSICG